MLPAAATCCAADSGELATRELRPPADVLCVLVSDPLEARVEVPDTEPRRCGGCEDGNVYADVERPLLTSDPLEAERVCIDDGFDAGSGRSVARLMQFPTSSDGSKEPTRAALDLYSCDVVERASTSTPTPLALPAPPPPAAALPLEGERLREFEGGSGGGGGGGDAVATGGVSTKAVGEPRFASISAYMSRCTVSRFHVFSSSHVASKMGVMCVSEAMSRTPERKGCVSASSTVMRLRGSNVSIFPMRSRQRAYSRGSEPPGATSPSADHDARGRPESLRIKFRARSEEIKERLSSGGEPNDPTINLSISA